MSLTAQHKVLKGARETRRYFAKFERIIGHLREVATLSQSDKLISESEAVIIEWYLLGLANTFTALSYKYLMANRVGGRTKRLLNIDKSDSGFPVYQELLQMAADAMQARDHLKSLPDQRRLKKDMVNHILTEHTPPSQLQYAMSQRLYYEFLQGANLFLTNNDPQAIWRWSSDKEQKRRYLVHWASYDSQTNVPAIYLMELEDTGKRGLPSDEKRWPRVQSHLMAQAVSTLKLLTIATGFDKDFDRLHPKVLRRIFLGPMYSHTFTQQSGPLRDVLADAQGGPGEDWALTWQVETLVSEGSKEEKSGIFSKADRQVYKIDPADFKASAAGTTDLNRALILPHKAYQVLREKDPKTLKNVRNYVVGKNSEIVSYR